MLPAPRGPGKLVEVLTTPGAAHSQQVLAPVSMVRARETCSGCGGAGGQEQVFRVRDAKGPGEVQAARGGGCGWGEKTCDFKGTEGRVKEEMEPGVP